MTALFTLAGVLIDLLIQMFAVFATGAVVGAVVRGGEWFIALILLGVGVGGLTVLTLRIWARRRILAVARAGSEEISTVTWLHFVCDAAWIAVAVMLVRGAQGPLWDTGTRAATITVFVLVVALCLLRVVARVRDDE